MSDNENLHEMLNENTTTTFNEFVPSVVTRTDEAAMLKREFVAELAEASDGRTLEGLCVPYNQPADVADITPQGVRAYREMFVKGAFQRAVKAPFRVWLNFEHNEGFNNVLGSGVEFEERDDGLYGKLKIDEGPEGDKALRMYRQKILESLSVEFKPMTRDKKIDGVVVRDNVHLNAVALCRQGAYDGAKVLAVRQQEPVRFERPKDLPEDVVEKLRRHGIGRFKNTE